MGAFILQAMLPQLRSRWSLLLLAAHLCSGQEVKKRKEVSIGYMLNYNPWKLAVNLGTFERTTGFTIKWLEVQDPAKATVAMANNEVQLVIANSADIGRAFARDMPARLLFICEELHHAEALVIHNSAHASNGGPIRTPRDLIGREVYVSYGSTAHYSLHNLLTEMQIPIVPDTMYMRGTECKLTPCHYTHDPRSVTIMGRNQAEILELWNSGKATAVYMGLPELNEVKKNGRILARNSMMAQWEKVTFTGMLGSTQFLDRTIEKYKSYDISAFMTRIVLEMAKANYYYENNTKEFGVEYVLDTIGTSRVSGSIASVTGGKNEKIVWEQLILRRYPTMAEQVSCQWMGCGNRSRVAWALRDMSKFLYQIKQDWNIKGGLNVALTQRDVKPHLRSVQDIQLVALAEVKESYHQFLDTSFMEDVLAAGQDGSYLLPTGAYVHLGYEVMAMFGPTRSFLIS